MGCIRLDQVCCESHCNSCRIVLELAGHGVSARTLEKMLPGHILFREARICDIEMLCRTRIPMSARPPRFVFQRSLGMWNMCKAESEIASS